MTEDDARKAISLAVLSDEEPVLSDAQLDDLTARARRPDADGNTWAAGSAIWTPTWDIDAAVAEGWRRKAAIAANRFDFSEDGQAFSRSQIYAHCIAQAEAYARRSMGALPVQPPA